MVESSRIWSGPSGLVAVYLVEGGVRVDIVGDVGSRTNTEVAVDYASNTVGIECVLIKRFYTRSHAAQSG